MNLFDALVDAALEDRPELRSLRPVVEKELLHHDILREMGKAGFLGSLTFIGGTCLRACYGSARLSEDLDFTGGADFTRDSLASLGEVLERSLLGKYGLPVSVSEPVRETGNVDTWKLRVVTRPDRPSLPAQRIHIDICAIASHDSRPMMLRNRYSVDLGTSGLILAAESREEILADKLVAFALRPNRVKNRDIWDALWLTSQGIEPDAGRVLEKLDDRKVEHSEFFRLFGERVASLAPLFPDYSSELQRFLPAADYERVSAQAGYWDYTQSLFRGIRDGFARELRS